MALTATSPASAATARKPSGQPKRLPAPNSDFYQLADVVTADEKAIVKKVRAYMETKVQPIINKYWSDDAFPFELLPSFKEVGLGGLGFQGYGCRGGSQKLFGFVAMEIARVDSSFCTFFGAHSSLAMGSIYADGPRHSPPRCSCRVVPPIRDARLVDLNLAVFMCNSFARQERVCRAQRPVAKIDAIATSASGRDRTSAFEPAETPANCGLFLRDRETSVRIGLRGGPGRIRTSNQTVMSGRPGSTCVRSTGVAHKSPGPTGADGGEHPCRVTMYRAAATGPRPS